MVRKDTPYVHLNSSHLEPEPFLRPLAAPGQAESEELRFGAMQKTLPLVLFLHARCVRYFSQCRTSKLPANNVRNTLLNGIRSGEDNKAKYDMGILIDWR